MSLEQLQKEERATTRRNRELAEKACEHLRWASELLRDIEPEATKGLYQVADLARSQIDIIETHLRVEAGLPRK